MPPTDVNTTQMCSDFKIITNQTILRLVMLASQDDAAMADYVNTMAGLTSSGEEANLASGDGELVSSSMLTRTIDAIDVCLNKIKELSGEHADDSPGDTMSLPGLGDTVSLPGLDDGTENPPESDVAEPSPSPTPSVPEDTLKGSRPGSWTWWCPWYPKRWTATAYGRQTESSKQVQGKQDTGKATCSKVQKEGIPQEEGIPHEEERQRSR